MNEVPPGTLVSRAAEGRKLAHCPYSGYHVGAALLTGDGHVVIGCNVENASYGLTVCAERVALWTAVAAGYRSFVSLAVVADGKDRPMPCGACRQVLAEFCDGRFRVYTCAADAPEHVEEFRLDALLPHGFRPATRS